MRSARQLFQQGVNAKRNARRRTESKARRPRKRQANVRTRRKARLHELPAEFDGWCRAKAK